MSGGYAISRVPFVAMMLIFFPSSSASSSATLSSSSSIRAWSCASVSASPSASEGVSVLILGRLLDVVFVHVAVLDLFEQSHAVGPFGPSFDVAHATAVGRDDLQYRPLREVVYRLLGLD